MSGPALLVDKSALQTLSRDEERFLFKHYFIAITPVLVLEIVGDLTKPPRSDAFTRSDAQWLADKLSPISSMVNVHYGKAMIASLLGDEVPMEGQILIDPSTARESVTGPGTRGIFIEESPEQKALFNWGRGIFDDNDQATSKRLREIMSSADLKEFAKLNVPHEAVVRDAKTLSDVAKFLNARYNSKDSASQLEQINLCLDRLQANEALRTKTNARWLAKGMPSFKDFAPYASYCWRVHSIFMHAMVNDLLPSKANSALDLEYLYYLPFCSVFTSGDRLHRAMAPLFMRDDQIFVDIRELKADLQWLQKEWAGLSDEKRREREVHYGDYPPDDESSFTSRAWKRYCRPREPFSGDISSLSTEEEKKTRLDEVMRKFELLRKGKRMG